MTEPTTTTTTTVDPDVPVTLIESVIPEQRTETLTGGLYTLSPVADSATALGLTNAQQGRTPFIIARDSLPTLIALLTAAAEQWPAPPPPPEPESIPEPEPAPGTVEAA